MAARWALRGILARYLDEPSDIDPTPVGSMSDALAAVALRIGEGGKPELAERPPRLRFNLSHSGGLALVAVAAVREVGVDVERIDPRRDVMRLAARALDPAAAAAVRAAIPRERAPAFHRAWAQREAAAKCHGVGLRGSPPATPVAVVALDPGPGFAAALAAAGELTPPLRLFTAEPSLGWLAR
ncbi:MAG TPA: 4'-phosphopantetheinyl transferase superfamily protein [Solirubrobacterales bacterium]|nr:4'-phosphopantetheinyl transferase superfamily protein [Solirubrobacterales bacterium]